MKMNDILVRIGMICTNKYERYVLSTLRLSVVEEVVIDMCHELPVPCNKASSTSTIPKLGEQLRASFSFETKIIVERFGVQL